MELESEEYGAVIGLPDSSEGPLEVGGQEFSAKTTQHYCVIFSSQG